MEDFTYKKPDEKVYFKTLIDYLTYKKEAKLLSIVKGSRCIINETTNFSNKRWNAYYTSVIFYVIIDVLKDISDDDKMNLIKYCSEIMPTETGFDVMNVDFRPSLEEESDTLSHDLEKIIAMSSDEIVGKILTDDIIQKGKEMTEIYFYLYCVENSLRLFIEKIGIKNFGKKYFQKLNINREIRSNIEIRKQDEGKHKWLSVRGDSDIFYIDFNDIAKIIINNWDLYCEYFPNQAWISTKIEELAKCRNLVAHNSYIDPGDIETIRVNYRNILKQLKQR